MDNTTLTINDPPIKKERNYGIDLLRLISMLMVVTLHVLGYGGVLNSVVPFTVKSEVFWTLEIICFGAVNIYAIISGLVGYRSAHKSRSLIYLCLQMLFFSVVITAIDGFMLVRQGVALNFEYVFFNLFPSIKVQWYFSAYFCLFFFMPLLDKLIDTAPKRTLKIAALFSFIIFCCYTQYYTQISGLRAGYSLLWLALLYAVGAYMAKYDPLKKWKIWQCLLVFFACIAVTVASRITIGILTQNYYGFAKRFDILVSYTSPTIVLGSIFMVSAFSKLNFKRKIPKKIILFLAPLAFGVYLIHCHPLVSTKMEGIFTYIGQRPIGIGVLLVIGSALAVFFICIFIDWIRLLIFKLLRVKQFSAWLEKIFKKMVRPLVGKEEESN